MGVRFGIATLDYIPSITGTTVADRPVTNVELYQYQLRTFRSATTGTADSRVIGDFTTAKTVRHFGLYNANFTNVQVEVADNTGFSTNYFNHGTFTLNKSRPTGRYQLWQAISGPLNRRYVRFTPSAPVSGATFYEIGALGMFDGITELIESPGWPKQYTVRQAQTRTAYVSGGEDVTEDGVRYVEMTFHKETWRRQSGVQAQLFDILDAGMSAPIFIHENLGDSSATWITRRTTDVEFQERYVVFNAEITFRECI